MSAGRVTLVTAAVVLAAAVAGVTVLLGGDFMGWLGWTSQSTREYAAWSSSVPALITLVGYSGLLGGLWHHVNCHVRGCGRIARFPVAGGAYKVCRAHHPDEGVRAGAPSAAQVHEAHWLYHSRAGSQEPRVRR